MTANAHTWTSLNGMEGVASARVACHGEQLNRQKYDYFATSGQSTPGENVGYAARVKGVAGASG